MPQTPDLYVVCKTCGNEVSPYITECPYCGTRLRKRAPRIDRDGTVVEGRRRRKASAPRLTRLRSGEIPGLRGDALRRPYATAVLVIASLFGLLALTVMSRTRIALFGPVDGEWWRVVTSPFLYLNVWYELAAVLAIAIYGWLLERRHGPVTVVALFAICGPGAMAVLALVDASPAALGGNGAALGLLAAWAVADVLRRARREPYDGDLLGTAIFAALLLAMPIAVPEANALVGLLGGAAGLVAGTLLAFAARRA